MSAGIFQGATYESDRGTFHNMKQQPETSALTIDGTANDESASAVDSPFWFKSTKGATEYGGCPRKVVIRWTAAPPTGYKAGTRLKIPVYQASVYAGIDLGDTGTYLGAACQVTGKIPESIYPAS